MQILWIRHGKTLGNVQRRYVGRTDEGLTDEAKLCLQKKQVLMQDLCVQTEGGRNPGKWYHAGAFVPDYVYSSPMMRCRETAEILFPGQVLCVQEGLQETDFGDFEYKNYEELKENPAYQAWIDSGGQMMVPNGESGAGFRHRCCRAYEQCVRDAASYDAFGDHAEDTVESGKVSELAQKEYTLISGNLSVEQGAELVKDYFSAGTPFPCENGVTVDVPEVRIFRLGDVYGYDYTVRRKYENVPFAYMDTGHYRFYADYLSDADIKHAYVVDDTGITAFCGYNEARKLTELISDDSMISFKQMLEFLRSGLASRLNINVERAGLVYFPVKLQGSAEKEEVIVLPCWEVFGVNEIKNEKIWIYVDVFTGEIYYYTTEINESSDEN